jgi:hypothetical protein
MPDWTKRPTLTIDEHGGVSEGGSEMSKIDGGDSKNPLYCSFCGKSQHEVRKLIAGRPSSFVTNASSFAWTSSARRTSRR